MRALGAAGFGISLRVKPRLTRNLLYLGGYMLIMSMVMFFRQDKGTYDIYDKTDSRYDQGVAELDFRWGNEAMHGFLDHEASRDS